MPRVTNEHEDPTPNNNPRTPTRDAISATEVAELLGLSRNSVYYAVTRGEIPHRRVGRRIIFSRSAIMAWLGSQERDVPERD